MVAEIILIEVLAVVCFIAGRLTAKPAPVIKQNIPVEEILDPVTVQDQRLLNELERRGKQHGREDEE